LSATPSETLWFEISLGRTALRAFERRRPCDNLALGHIPPALTE
jgi:hypothetical protein